MTLVLSSLISNLAIFQTAKCLIVLKLNERAKFVFLNYYLIWKI